MVRVRTYSIFNNYSFQEIVLCGNAQPEEIVSVYDAVIIFLNASTVKIFCLGSTIVESL